MIDKDIEKLIINKSEKLDVFSDSFELIDALTMMAENSENSQDRYFLKESAQHISAMYDALRSLIYFSPTEKVKCETLQDIEKFNLLKNNLSVRALNCLLAEGIDNWPSFKVMNKSQFLKLTNFGYKSFNELQEVVTSQKLQCRINTGFE